MWTKFISWVLSIVFAVCSFFGISVFKPGGDRIYYSANQTVVTVTLDENPSTGYRWEYKVADASVVRNCEDGYLYDGDKGIVGAGGTRVLSFLGEKSGTTTVTFLYQRPWESVPIQTLVVEIAVAENRTLTATVLSQTP